MPVPMSVAMAITMAVGMPGTVRQRSTFGDHLVQALVYSAHRPALSSRRHVGLSGLTRRQGRVVGSRRENCQPLFVDRPSLLDELATGKLPDDAGLNAVLEQVVVLALQAEANTFSDDVAQSGHDEYADTCSPRDPVQRYVQVGSDDVVRTFGPQHAIEDDHGYADGRSGRCVTRPVIDVMLASIAGDPLFQERP